MGSAASDLAAEAASRDTGPMFGTIFRVAMLRFVPRRLVPLLTAWQVVRMIRGRRSSGTTTTESTPRTRFRRR